MLHKMKLHIEPFNSIVNKVKTIELRLNDEKRQLIKIGDFIEFTNNLYGKTCLVKVVNLHHFDSFKSLYENLDLLKCGYTKDDVIDASYTDMEKYYSKEEQDIFGVLGIEIKLQESRITFEINEELLKLSDYNNIKFNQKLIPNIDPSKILGIKTPILRNLAKRLKTYPNIEFFLNDLPHLYHDENMLHAFLICEIKDYDKLMIELEKFLSYIDNWAVCDSLICKIFKKHKVEVFEKVKNWLLSNHTYTIRYAIKVLKDFYLDTDFNPLHLEMVSNIKSKEYYVQMMIAWYFSEALVKQYNEAIKYLENHKLESIVHKMTIRKALDSFRITNEQKEYIKTLK